MLRMRCKQTFSFSFSEPSKTHPRNSELYMFALTLELMQRAVDAAHALRLRALLLPPARCRARHRGRARALSRGRSRALHRGRARAVNRGGCVRPMHRGRVHDVDREIDAAPAERALVAPDAVLQIWTTCWTLVPTCSDSGLSGSVRTLIRTFFQMLIRTLWRGLTKSLERQSYRHVRLYPGVFGRLLGSIWSLWTPLFLAFASAVGRY